MTEDSRETQGAAGDQPVGQISFTVSADAWRRFESRSLRERIQRELVETQDVWPAAGSPMDADNKFLAPFHSSVHELVLHRLFSAFDHLQLVTWTLEHLGHPLIFSKFSMIRAALAGASTAHWIVCGEPTLRRMRALKLAF